MSQVRSDPNQPLRYVGPWYTNNGDPLTEIPSTTQALFAQIGEGNAGVHMNGLLELFDPVVLGEIELPNGKKYVFKYNVYGEIDKVTLSTGGYHRYDYGYVEARSSLSQSVAYAQSNRGVIAAWDSPTGLSGDEYPAWVYQPNGNHTVITAPNGTVTKHFFHKSGVPIWMKFNTPVGAALEGKIYETQVFNNTNTMLRRTLSQWVYTGIQGVPGAGDAGTPIADSDASRNARMTRQVEILLDTGGQALATATEMDYDDDLNVIATRSYDYTLIDQATAQTATISVIANGVLLRTEETTYLLNDSSVAQGYRDRNLVALPSKKLVKNGTGTVIAATEFKYDEAGYLSPPYGAVTNWIDPSVPYRGNVTTTRSWNNNGNAAWSGWNSGAWIETHTEYDRCGNVRKTWDGKQNLTETSYLDSYSDGINRNTYAFPTETTSPGSILISKAKYHYLTGKAVESTDPNNVKTQIEYNDSLQRVTKTCSGNNARQPNYG
ncbi:MAG: hypothetical protein HOP19_14820 [Acidobacteria bacterium]|nr:hypothetical protein [Acidobacteriota bacterium]